MRIVAPVSRVAEVAVLAEAGATELYCGLVPPDWRGRFQSISANRRPSGNLASYADLAEAVRSERAPLPTSSSEMSPERTRSSSL